MSEVDMVKDLATAVDIALRSARNAALEQAAKYHDERMEEAIDVLEIVLHRVSAAGIRKLIER